PCTPPSSRRRLAAQDSEDALPLPASQRTPRSTGGEAGEVKLSQLEEASPLCRASADASDEWF
ncbi:unnamed protein product, partial [Polarella glacialis]